MSIEVKIRLRLKDTLGGQYFMDAWNDEWGIMHYRHCSRSGMPHALSNIQMKRDLPHTVDGYQLARDMVPDIISAVESGTYDVAEVVFAKSKRVGALA